MKNSQRVVISAPYFQPVVARFMPIFKKHNIEVVVPEVKERLNETELLNIIGDIEGIICGDDALSEVVLRKAKKLKVIAKWGTGIDSIDQEACKALGIAVRNTPNAFTYPVADSTMAYILNFSRNISAMDKAMKQGIWLKIPGYALNEKKLGIIGCGNIGKAVARRALAFGMKVYMNDIKLVEDELIGNGLVEMVNKDFIYENCDFISLHCDLNSTSRHLICKDTLCKMKKCPYIINTARGGIVNESDLVAALLNKTVAGAGLDVFEHEPISVNSPLLKMDNVFHAPHNSNSSPLAWEKVHKNTINNLLEGMGLKAAFVGSAL